MTIGFKVIILLVLFSVSLRAQQNTINSEKDIDLTLVNDVNYDLSKPIFAVRPSLGRGLRDMQNSAGGSACTSCAH